MHTCATLLTLRLGRGAGSVFVQIPIVLKDPSKVLSILGTALPASSNFFINYTCTQAFLIIPFRWASAHLEKRQVSQTRVYLYQVKEKPWPSV